MLRFDVWGPVLAAVGVVLACADCDRVGCDALSQPARAGGTGVAGVIAQTSDVVSNGCDECPLGQASLELWRLEAPVADEAAAQELVEQRSPDVTVAADGRYRQDLEPGAYLFCSRPNCIEVQVNDGIRLTVNVKRRYGPTGFFVFRQAAASPQEDFGFSVSY